MFCRTISIILHDLTYDHKISYESRFKIKITQAERRMVVNRNEESRTMCFLPDPWSVSTASKYPGSL